MANITIARFPRELPFDRGDTIAFATVSELSVQDPVTNLAESPFLQPLRQFGFTIYGSPGPP
jgi:hypothetical protein